MPPITTPRRTGPVAWLLNAALLAVLAGCGPTPPPGPDPAVEQAAAAAALQRIESAAAAGQHEGAVIYATEFLDRHPQAAAAAAIRARLPGLQQAAEAQREARRLAGLWTYHAVEAAGGVSYTAYIRGVASATPPAPELRLVIRRHPEWGQSTYLLVGDGGDFACTASCELAIRFDDAAAESFAISRAPDVDPPAVFIDDDPRLLKRLADTRSLQFELPLVDRRRLEYRFEIAGLDFDRLAPPAEATP